MTERVDCGGLSRSDNRRCDPSIEREVAHVAGATEQDSQLVSDTTKGD